MSMFVIAPPHPLHAQQAPQPVSSDGGGGGGPGLSLPSSAALGVGVSIFPLLAAAAHCGGGGEECGGNSGGPAYWGLRRLEEQPVPVKKDRLGADEADLSRKAAAEAGGGALRVCEDCGNRAKKECSYRRCRTCCRSRGYSCATHVKSTWVPAAVRRERKMVAVGSGVGALGGIDVDVSSGSSSGAKRTRILTSSHNGAAASYNSISNATTSKSFDAGSYHQEASFRESLPGQVRAPAVFRCIRVTAVSDAEAELVYQATVKISGHVFKGFLYDHGVDAKNAFPCISQLHLDDPARGKNGGSPPVVNPSNAYAASAN